MKAYIGGAMSNLPENNFPAFRDAAEKLRAEGWDIVSPVELDESEGIGATVQLGDAEYKDALARDLRCIMDVEAIILLPGWESSKGARTELSLANHYGIEVFYYLGFGQTTKGRSVGDMLFDDTTVFMTDPDTGGKKGQKKCRFDLIPTGPLAEVAAIYGRGAEKYAERNWELGYAWSLSYAALQRHLNRFWSGESYDPETGLHHLAHATFHLLALMDFERKHPEKDDRPV